MAMRLGLLGKKIGMTQVFADDGERVPVTVIQTGPCVVVGKRTVDKDGYSALVLGFDEKPLRLANKAELGLAKAANTKPVRVLREFRAPAAELEAFTVGQVIGPSDVFGDGAAVDVEGQSKGKGYQGVIKRHHMKGMRATHGTHEFFRHGGSIGCRLTPQRVHKGKRMAGQMGNEVVTVQNLQLFRILAEDNCIMVRGSIPGSTNGYVVVSKAATRTAYKRKGMGKEEVRSKNPLKASKKAAAGRG
ncbi:MAG: 50S ribosomal protein L3 [Kofleriaceae bacterium]|jgi:large subunit ribosomal protein L3|nr:50S ribosomal protein L3 [Kofleriaceae bacterium]MBP9168969.1 50S ribosomal protein L3 [Kofleriaceae bacterium]MBP9858822.1 50S ribosomal protein L3 [Kofleriaceae bacterium]